MLRGIVPGRLEEERKLEVVGNTEFSDLMKRYEEFLFHAGNHTAELIGNVVMTPSEIDQFLQATVQYERHTYYRETWHFADRLIQNSYGAGHNDFVIRTHILSEINHLLYYRSKNADRPLRVTIDGPVGHSLAQYTTGLDITVIGDAGKGLAYQARDSVFTLYGDIVECGFSSVNCIFKTPNKRTLKKLIGSVSKTTLQWLMTEVKHHPSRNKIIYIRPDGKEKLVANYANYAD